jgi:hypothetical protein
LALLDPGAQVAQQLACRWLVRAGHVAEHAQQLGGGPAEAVLAVRPQLFGHARPGRGEGHQAPAVVRLRGCIGVTGADQVSPGALAAGARA